MANRYRFGSGDARPVIQLVVGLVLISALMDTQAAVADRLILRDGSEIETRGPWKVKGRQVVFTLQSGTLSSLRLDDVDLEASKTAGEMAAQEPADGAADESMRLVGDEAARLEPILVITDRDIPRAKKAGNVAASSNQTEDASVAGEESPEAEAQGDGQGAGREILFAAEGLEVAGWQTLDSPRGGIEITGVLANRSDQLVAEASVRVKVVASDGVERTYTAEVGNATLGAGQQSPFRILLPDVVAVDDALTFDLEGSAVRPRILPSTPPTTDEADGAGLAEGGGSF